MGTFEPTRLLVTGGAGFIGSNFVRRMLTTKVARVVVLDALTYAGDRKNLDGISDPRVVFVQGDICDRAVVERVFTEHAIDAVAHLAAESHVDRSIEAAGVFVQTNVTGTFTLLDVALRTWGEHPTGRRFLHVSTDEVFGALGDTGSFTERSPYAPNSPYAASKAGSDLLARAYVKTYGLPVVVTNCCNNYGPYQLPEKLIPLVITNAAKSLPLPVYGEGKQVREWLHVADHCAALWAALTAGTDGESYNFGSGEELPNLALVERIADLVDDELARPRGTSRALITLVPDRKGHDFRYAIDSTKARTTLGWTPTRTLDRALAETVRWYVRSGR
ncbi:MAG: dTDP-glucose 4,6-dehydratase [Deltaproteobacteria bacterium]|nr:dTDP-glucose 4,6-dehydratase [Deltaproteobacteria bacterium]